MTHKDLERTTDEAPVCSDSIHVTDSHRARCKAEAEPKEEQTSSMEDFNQSLSLNRYRTSVSVFWI